MITCKLIGGCYDIVKLIAQTAHSSVYLVRHQSLDVFRIAKVIGKNTPDYERAYREVRILKNLDYKGIPKLYDYFENDTSICIIEQYIGGKSLTDYMLEHGRLPMEQTLNFALQMCHILEYLHTFEGKGRLHLDLKPDNVQIDDKGTLWLLDFDNSIFVGETVQQFYGSVDFAAPEQFAGQQPDVRADVYSLGKLLSYMDTGQVSSGAEVLYHSELSSIFTKCIHHDKRRRYADVLSLRKALLTLQKKEKANDQSYIVYVYGLKEGVGTTHLSLCITAFLQKNGLQTVCISSDLFMQKNDRLMKNGIFLHDGLFVSRNADRYIRGSFDDFRVMVIDGKCGQEYQQMQVRATIQIAVTTYGYDKRKEWHLLTNHAQSDVLFFNHIGGSDFYHVRKEITSHMPYYRMPCMYAVRSGNAEFERTCFEIFSEQGMLSQKKFRFYFPAKKIKERFYRVICFFKKKH